jgi:hypothetical protein
VSKIMATTYNRKRQAQSFSMPDEREWMPTLLLVGSIGIIISVTSSPTGVKELQQARASLQGSGH